VLLSFPDEFTGAKRPRSRPQIIVARVWPPRKRDFLAVPTPIKHMPYWRGLFALRRRNA
jgi:hypothetical protein